MHFAECTDVTRGSDDDRGIVKYATRTLGNTSDDEDVMALRGVDPNGGRLAPRNLFSERKSLLSVTKHVPRIGKLGENDQAGAFARRFVNSLQPVCEISLLGADDRLHLNAGNRDLAFRSRHAVHSQNKKPPGSPIAANIRRLHSQMFRGRGPPFSASRTR